MVLVLKFINFIKEALHLALSLGVSFALLYTIFGSLRKSYKLKFESSWSSGFGFHTYLPDKLTYATIVFKGLLKNQSLDPNTLTDVYLVVWRNYKRNSTIRYGCAGVTVKNLESGQEIKLPLLLEPREAKNLEITIEFPVTGTSDQKILGSYNTNKPTAYVVKNRLERLLLGWKMRANRKTNYELAFEDVNENLFDMSGNLRNKREINLQHTLSNYLGWKWYRQKVKIYWVRFKFFGKLLLKRFGIFS